MNECPHPDCERSISRERYACKEHWFSLPEEIRRAIWNAYGGYGNQGAKSWIAADKQAKEFWHKERVKK